MGWLIIIGGIISGFALGKEVTGYYYSREEFSLSVALIYWVAGIVSGTLFIGLGKIIELLSIIANKDYIVVNDVVENKSEPKKVETSPQKTPAVKEEVKLPDISNADLKQFFEKAVTMEKYLDIQKCWREMQLDRNEEYAAYTKIIEKQAYIERMYGSNPREVSIRVKNWANGKLDLD